MPGFVLPRYSTRLYSEAAGVREAAPDMWWASFSSTSTLLVGWPTGGVILEGAQTSGLSLLGIPGLRPTGG